MKSCGSCGANNPDDASFCGLCLARSGTGPAGRAPGERLTRDPAHGAPVASPGRGKLGPLAIKLCLVAVPLIVVALVVMGVKLSRRIPEPYASARSSRGIDTRVEPSQIAVDDARRLYAGPGGARADALARYNISAKVLGVHIDRRYGQEDSLFPIDLALAWGKVAGSDYDGYLDYHFDNIWIYNQWLEYQIDAAKVPAGITRGDITSHISNNHIFPADENVYDAVANLGSGQKVKLDGYLVSATEPDGRKVVSSMSRTDTEAGACECFYVTSVQVGDVVYQ